MKLSAQERVELIRQIYSFYNLLGEEGGLAGVVLTPDAYEATKRLFGSAALPYQPGEITLDPAMEHSFVVNGLLILRGEPVQ